MPLISLFTSNFKPIGNSFREMGPDAPLNDFEYVILPNNDLTYIFIPDNDLFNTFIVDNDIQYILLPDNDINNTLIPSDDVIYTIIPNGDGTYTLIPNNDLTYSLLQPSPSPTPSVTPTVTPTMSVTPTPTPTMSVTPTSTITPTMTLTPTKSAPVPGQFIYIAQAGILWNGYGANYLSFGRSQDGTNRTPLAGWYFIDSNNVVRQLLNTPLWFGGGSPSPTQNGNGWMAVANGPFSISASATTITFYETMPVIPSATPTPSITSTITPTPTITETPTSTLTPTPSVTSTVTPTPTNTITPTTTQTPTSTITPSVTPSVTLTPTPTSTLPPLGFTLASTCANNGSITISNLVGVASGQYQFGSGTHTTESSALNSPTWTPITGGSGGLVTIGSSGTYWVAVRETANPSNILAKSVTINCVTPTPTSTITPTITPTATPSVTPTISLTPTPSVTSSLTPTTTPTPSITPTTFVATQLLTNPEFSLGTTGWTATGGFGTWSFTSSNQVAVLNGVLYFTYVSRTISQSVNVSSFIGSANSFTGVINIKREENGPNNNDTYNFTLLFKNLAGTTIASKTTGSSVAPLNYTDVTLTLNRSEIPSTFNNINTVEVQLTGQDLGNWNGNHGPWVDYVRLNVS
jgi:hypothetical protein